MVAAISMLQRRIEELRTFDVSSVQEQFDTRFEVLDQKIDDALVEIFGAETIEYQRYQGAQLEHAAINADSLEDARRDYKRALIKQAGMLQGIVETLQEKSQARGETPRGRAVLALADLDLHPEIARAAGERFRNGQYADAVEAACKALDQLVKLRSGRDNLSGTDLMQTVFSANDPLLRFNAMQTESERSEQKGMMFLYAGAMLALRNPRAHELIEDKPEQAIEYIGFLSMLAKSLDRTTQA